MTSRQDILKEYFRLVDEYHKYDFIFEQNEDSDDAEVFNTAWRMLDKAHQHMVNYRDKHNITRQELTEATQGVRVDNVAEAVRVGGGLLEGK